MRRNETEEALLKNRGTMILIFKQKHTPLTVAHKTSKENRKRSAKGGTMKYYKTENLSKNGGTKNKTMKLTVDK